MTGVRCVVCRDLGEIVGSVPGASTSAPPVRLPCPRYCRATDPRPTTHPAATLRAPATATPRSRANLNPRNRP